MSSQSVTNEASKLELKLGSMIEELKSNSQLDVFEVQERNKEIRLSMNQLRTKIKILEGYIRNAKSDDEREEHKKVVEWHNAQYNELQRNLQRANLINKTVRDQQNKAELTLTEDSAMSVRSRRKQDNTVEVASAVTESLMELRQHLAAGLSNSEATLHKLAESSGVLRDSNAEMKNISAHVDISSRLITKFSRREVVDRLLIFCGLILFFSVVIYILKKRLIG